LDMRRVLCPAVIEMSPSVSSGRSRPAHLNETVSTTGDPIHR
jgi:hypothetical protein